MITYTFKEEYLKRFGAAEFTLMKIDKKAGGRVNFTFSSEAEERVVLSLEDPGPRDWPYEDLPPLAGSTLVSASIKSVVSFYGKAVFRCRSISMLVQVGDKTEGTVLYGASGGDWTFELFPPGSKLAIARTKEASRLGAEAVDPDSAMFDVMSLRARPWVAYSAAECEDGLFRAVFVQTDPKLGEDGTPRRLVIRVGDREGAGAAREALAKVAAAPCEGAVALVGADAFLNIAMKAYDAERLAINGRSMDNASVGIVDMYV